MTTAPAPKKSNKTLVIVLTLLGAGALLVPCCGVLSAIAIPAFVSFQARAKASEAHANLRTLRAAAESYYVAEHLGPGGAVQTRCTVGAARSSNTPSERKSLVDEWPESFVALGFAPADPLYFQYEIVGDGGCGHGPNEPLYSFRAHGDLDGDRIPSLRELVVGTGPDGELAPSPPMFVLDELE